MSSPKETPPAKLLIALMFAKYPIDLVSELERNFGRIQERSIEIDFRFTDYYEKEFGNELKKIYLVFSDIFDIEKLPDVKRLCHELENIHSIGGRRVVNIDPGYVTKNSVVLASFKERAHRIYLRDGVYADLELVFENGSWHPFEWTFADIKEEKIKSFLKKIKEIV